MHACVSDMRTFTSCRDILLLLLFVFPITSPALSQTDTRKMLHCNKHRQQRPDS